MLLRTSYKKKKNFFKSFFYTNLHQNSSEIKKITIFFVDNANISLHTLIKISTFLELITLQRSYFIRSKKSLALLKIRRGIPLGAKVTLRKNNKDYFLQKLIWSVLPNINLFTLRTKFFKIKNLVFNSFLFTIPSVLNFLELQSFYFFFKNFKDLKILISYSSKNNKFETYYLNRLYQIPVY